MISGGTRVVRNTIWSYQPVMAVPSRHETAISLLQPIGFTAMSREAEDRQLRAALSARLSKLCNYSGKTARR